VEEFADFRSEGVLESVFLSVLPPEDRIEAGFEAGPEVVAEFRLLELFVRRNVLSASITLSSVMYAFRNL
jgi:hypothetical protein